VLRPSTPDCHCQAQQYRSAGLACRRAGPPPGSSPQAHPRPSPVELAASERRPVIHPKRPAQGPSPDASKHSLSRSERYGWLPLSGRSLGVPRPPLSPVNGIRLKMLTLLYYLWSFPTPQASESPGAIRRWCSLGRGTYIAAVIGRLARTMP
jgi:hypothetical protein